MTPCFIVCLLLFSIVSCDLPLMSNEKDALEYLSRVEAGTDSFDSSLIQKVTTESSCFMWLVC